MRKEAQTGSTKAALSTTLNGCKHVLRLEVKIKTSHLITTFTVFVLSLALYYL